MARSWHLRQRRSRGLPMAEHRPTPIPDAAPQKIGRRHFLGFLIAAPTLAVAAQIGGTVLDPKQADAAIASPPLPEDVFDLGDMQTLAAAPTSGLVAVQVNTDGTASFAVPRTEVGQGMTTAVAMMIAEELDLPLAKVHV